MKKIKEILIITFNYLFDVLIYFSFVWLVTLAIAFSCVLPKEGVTALIFAIVMVSVNRIKN